jgi:hypothetical protein
MIGTDGGKVDNESLRIAFVCVVDFALTFIDEAVMFSSLRDLRLLCLFSVSRGIQAVSEADAVRIPAFEADNVLNLLTPS